MRNRHFAAVLAPLAVAVLACGGSSNDNSPAVPSPNPTPATGPTITIQGMAFVPQSLDVTPGAVVTVHNLDTMAHSVTSESAPGTFRPGAVAGVSFDTGVFTGTRTFTIPATTPVGTVVPYYCTSHLGAMGTPNGELRVVAPSAAATPAPTPSATPAPTNPYSAR